MAVAAVRRRGIVWLSVWAGLLACAEPAPPDRPTGVLLVVSDTLRADALSCSGGPEPTPHVCALAERGALFERAYASAPWTLPSSVALFSGGHPTQYARHAPGAGERSGAQEDYYRIPDDERLLAESLREEGWDAVASVQSTLARAPNTFQGFELLVPDPIRTRAVVRAGLPEVLGRVTSPVFNAQLAALEYLLRLEAQPFFLVVWIHDPHAVYDPSPSYVRGAGLDRRELPRPLSYYRSLGHRTDPERGWTSLRDESASFTSVDRETLRALYHLEVASVDERIGWLLRALELRGRLDDTLVLVTSDHGEGFGEHGLYLHGNSFFDEVMRVPLVVAGPGVAGPRRPRMPVSHVDLMPTLREILDVPCCAGAQGHSLAALLATGEETAPDRFAYLVAPMRLAGGDAWVEDGFKLVASGGEVALYDLERDPEERRDLATKEPARVARMLARLGALREENERRRLRNLERSGAATLEAVRRQTREQLEALGYVEPGS